MSPLPRLVLLLWLGTTSCFGSVSDPVRHYYTLHLEPLRPVPMVQVQGLLRVRDLDAESAYDRFQIVMRKSPFELLYRNREVWAVKPNRMLSDLIARGIAEQEVFSGVNRELSERRPDYLLSGELHSIEIYDSGDAWYAHAAFSLQITHFETGKLLWTYHFDERKDIAPHNFALAVRAMSELITEAIEKAIVSMEHMRSPDDLLPEDQQKVPLMRPLRRTKSPAASAGAPRAPGEPSPTPHQEPLYLPEAPQGVPHG
ncbi:MAG: hypothetical protein EOO40_03255 [Deltaproteobacteria bacterium]|nr:MAG: hypothetical protein EOO40_03255 [Deltaproteobacteria bacterium]